MKKYMSGFVPINFKQSGKILLVIGIFCLIAKLVSYLTGWFNPSNYVICFGIILIMLSLYLVFIVPKE